MLKSGRRLTVERINKNRTTRQRLIPHINYALVAKRHPPMYLMHRFRARKPHNVVADYIKHYSRRGEIICDPFCGSGVVAVEALRQGRKAIVVDLDPLATFLTRMTLIPVDLKDLKAAFEKIKGKVKNPINELYKTKCTKCGNADATILCTIWSYVVKCQSCRKDIVMADARHAKGKKQAIYVCPHCEAKFNYANSDIDYEAPIKIQLKCNQCKETMWKKLEKEDLQRLEKIENMEIPFWFPEATFYYPTGKRFMTKRREESIHDIFTKRELIALSILNHEIESLSDEVPRDLLKLAFSSMLEIVSKLNPYRPRSVKSGWTVHEYWTPAVHAINNVWEAFEHRYRKIEKGKKQSNKEIKSYREAKGFDDLAKGDANILILTQSALDLSNIRSSSNAYVDYVFTDPPYGGSIQYFELDVFRIPWLKGERNDRRFNLRWWKDEITINRYQGKDFDYYHNVLCASFKKVYEILKPGGYMTVTFHSTEVRVYNSIIRAVVYAGFELEKILYQSPAVRSAKASLHPYTSASGDYYIRFRKPERPRTLPHEKEIDVQRFERVVVESVKRIIAERGEPTSYTDILKGIYIELDKHGYLLAAKPENIEKIVRRYEGKEFVFIEKQGWWFKDPGKYLLNVVPLQDRVETAIIQVLRRQPKVSFDDVLQEIFINFPNALTPNPPSIRSFLDEYAERTGDRKWRLTPTLHEREREHNQMIVLITEIGKKMGYKIWVGQKEQTSIYDKKPLSKWCDFRDLGFLDIPLDKIKGFLSQIDVMWLKEGRIAYAFEVEFTTAITEAFNRCSNIPREHLTKKIIIIPEERENLLYKKVNSELLRERVKEEGWKFIFFKDLKQFYDDNMRKRIINVEDFKAIWKKPLEAREKQITLDIF